MIEVKLSDHNAPKVFIKRQLEKYGVIPRGESIIDLSASSQMVTATLLREQHPGGVIPFEELVNNIKPNNYYNIYDGGEVFNARNIQSSLIASSTAIRKSDSSRMNGYIMVDTEGEKHPLACHTYANIREREGKEGLQFVLYKDKKSREVFIPMEDIKKITLVTLITLRGFKREEVYKENSKKQLSEIPAGDFNPDQI